MIISFRHQFIFLAIPKTASHTFRVALRPYLDANDWEQCHLLEQKFFPVEPLARLKHGHFTHGQIQPYLLPGVWRDFYKFCTVRNPYDRFISHSYFIHRDDDSFKRDPLGGMKRLIENPPIPFLPQHHYIVDEEGQITVNFVARLESLQAGFDHICEEIGIPKAQLGHINPAKRPPYQEILDQELQEMVSNYYARDFEIFGYSTQLN